MPDPVEARMKFIIEQQAQFSADMQMLKERQAEALRTIEEHTRRMESTDERIRKLVDVTLSLAHHGEETDLRLRQLGEETDRRLGELAESGAHTDRRLDALIDTVDKLVRRNGSPS